MPRKRKTPNREELKRLARRKRVADAWMAGASAAAIAKSERISTAAVYTDLRAASDVILPAGTKEQLLARNFARLEDVIRANREGMEQGDDTATRNCTRAISEQNRMLGVTNRAVNFTVNAGQQGDGSLEWDLEGSVGRTITFVKPPPRTDILPPDPPRPYYYSPPPRLIGHKPAEPAPFRPDPPPNPPEPPSGPRTELDQGLRPGWVMDAPPSTKKPSLDGIV